MPDGIDCPFCGGVYSFAKSFHGICFSRLRLRKCQRQNFPHCRTKVSRIFEPVGYLIVVVGDLSIRNKMTKHLLDGLRAIAFQLLDRA